MSENLISFDAAECFSKDTIDAWRHSQTRGKEAPYFVLSNPLDACGIISYEATFGTELVICYGNIKECEDWMRRKISKDRKNS